MNQASCSVASFAALLCLLLTQLSSAQEGNFTENEAEAPQAGLDENVVEAEAEAPEFEIIEPVEVREERNNTVRVYRLSAGQASHTQRAGTIGFLEVSENILLLKRLTEFPIPLPVQGEYHVGNSEYLEILSVDVEDQEVEFCLRARKIPWWDFLSR